MRFSKLVLWGLHIVLIYSSCKEPNIPLSPYGNLKSTSADFIVEQKVGDRWFRSDTVISGQFNHVRFTAKENADTYRWRIGSEVITSKSFVKTWLPENSFIPVELVVTKNTDIENPFDDGIDTTRRSIYVWHSIYGSGEGNTPQNSSLSSYLPIYGTYYGESSFERGTQKYVTIIDTVWTDGINRVRRVGLIKGIPYKSLTTESQRNSTLFNYIDDVGVTALHLNMESNIGGILGTPTIPKMEGYAWLNPENWNKITIDYKFLDTTSKKWIKDSFTGVKVW